MFWSVWSEGCLESQFQFDLISTGEFTPGLQALLGAHIVNKQYNFRHFCGSHLFLRNPAVLLKMCLST